MPALEMVDECPAEVAVVVSGPAEAAPSVSGADATARRVPGSRFGVDIVLSQDEA